MKIKFSKKDPRAGMVVEMEGDRAQGLIDAGAAERVSDSTKTAPAEPSEEVKAVTQAAAKAVAKKAAK